MTGPQYFAALAKQLKENCISHAELAREAKVKETQLSRWFNGRVKNPTLDSIHNLDRALNRLLQRGAGCG
jgi:transcriptional regulator with XRE-family HTH domain